MQLMFVQIIWTIFFFCSFVRLKEEKSQQCKQSEFQSNRIYFHFFFVFVSFFMHRNVAFTQFLHQTQKYLFDYSERYIRFIHLWKTTWNRASESARVKKNCDWKINSDEQRKHKKKNNKEKCKNYYFNDELIAMFYGAKKVVMNCKYDQLRRDINETFLQSRRDFLFATENDCIYCTSNVISALSVRPMWTRA